MPKMKTKSGAKKRFKLTASGKVKAGQAGKRHGMIKRTNDQIRKLRGTTVLAKQDAKVIRKKYLPKRVMSRVKRGVTKHARHKKVIDAAKGYRGRRKNTFRIANQAVEKAGQYAYIGRKLKKRQFRALWIQRINAAARLHGMTYGRFMDGLNKAGIKLDRKVLADMAGNEPEAFKALVETAKKHASAPHTVKA